MFSNTRRVEQPMLTSACLGRYKEWDSVRQAHLPQKRQKTTGSDQINSPVLCLIPAALRIVPFNQELFWLWLPAKLVTWQLVRKRYPARIRGQLFALSALIGFPNIPNNSPDSEKYQILQKTIPGVIFGRSGKEHKKDRPEAALEFLAYLRKTAIQQRPLHSCLKAMHQKPPCCVFPQ